MLRPRDAGSRVTKEGEREEVGRKTEGWMRRGGMLGVCLCLKGFLVLGSIPSTEKRKRREQVRSTLEGKGRKAEKGRGKGGEEQSRVKKEEGK